MIRTATILTILLGVGSAQAADLPQAAVSDGASPAVNLPQEADTEEDSPALAQAPSMPGMRVFSECRSAINRWAQPYGPIDMDVVSLGPVRNGGDGVRSTKLYVRIVYDVEGGRETRTADVDCSVDRNDGVTVVPTMR